MRDYYFYGLFEERDCMSKIAMNDSQYTFLPMKPFQKKIHWLSYISTLQYRTHNYATNTLIGNKFEKPFITLSDV